MQAIKEKLNDISAMRKAKAEAKEEEKAEKELAKVKGQVAYEVRRAREAEAAMDRHVTRAAEKAAEYERKQQQHHPAATHGGDGSDRQDFYDAKDDSYGTGNPSSLPSEYSADATHENRSSALNPDDAAYRREIGGVHSGDTAGIDYAVRGGGGTPTKNKLM